MEPLADPKEDRVVKEILPPPSKVILFYDSSYFVTHFATKKCF
jgi:hypothetical protein